MTTRPMTAMELTSKIEELKEIEALIREAQEEADKLKEEIKKEMTKQNTDEMKVGRYVVHWTVVHTNRFDSKAFQQSHLDIYNMYVKESISRRFSISG
jgi:predicted phage-related endonuclease